MVKLRHRLCSSRRKTCYEKSKKNNFPTLLARWKAQQSYRSSLKEHDIGEKQIILYDPIALEKRDYTATKDERTRYSQNWVLSINAEGSQLPRQQRPDL